MKRCQIQIPAFGNWDSFEGVPITKYFESAIQAGLIRGSYIKQHVNGDFSEEPVPVPVPALVPVKPNFHNKKKRGGNEKQRKKSRVCDAKSEQNSPKNKGIKTPKAVDEDLYKIPPEFLYQKHKTKRLLSNFCTGCMCISSVV